MRFSEDGPDFPAELLDALLAGEVVFVCGAGVSNPQLPLFKRLVERVYEELRMEPDGGEEAAISGGRFEEALGSLARRLVHESKMYRAVETILLPPEVPDLANHRTLLRLSRDLDNRYSLVTTNFDPLFEQVVAADRGPDLARQISVAGQSLPAPGSEQFGGVIHLHGRLANTGLGLTRTPLVLTSAEYGDAYMRSGWASRFLFDLARCKTLVLVGYSASDAPVRYFLNVLQADRERFTDLKPVYALDGVKNDDQEADERWSLIAVQAIPYRLRTDGSPEHGTLWNDLAQLAVLVERPKPARRQRAQDILSKPYADSTPQDRADLEWLIKGKGDLWDVILASVSDPQWIDQFSEQQLWRANDPEWFIPEWIGRGWTDVRRLHAATRWCGSFDAGLSKRIESMLRHPRVDIPLVWRRAWHMLTQSNIERTRLRGENSFQLAQSLQQIPLLDLDLRKGIDALTPHLKIEAPWPVSEASEAQPEKLNDLYRVSMTVGSTDEVAQVTNALAAMNRARRTCEVASAALKSTVASAGDAEMIEDQWDQLDYSVPSVEAHDQNDFHDGVIHLVNLLVLLLPTLAVEDRSSAIAMATEWRNLPGRLGPRMWLHALRNPQLFDLDAVLEALRSLSPTDFWAHRMELILVLRERLVDATPLQVEPIIERIACEGPVQYEDMPPRADETDWRPHARDHAMWVRLSALKSANALTAQGRELLNQIRDRTPHLQREVEESDLFSSYSSGVRRVVGDPVPLLNASPEERLDVAHELMRSADFEQRAGWTAYCRADPRAGFATLNRTGFRPEDLSLWLDLINAVAFPVPAEPVPARARIRLIRAIFNALEFAPDDALQALALALVGLFQPHAAVPARVRTTWWDRLWYLAAHEEPPEGEDLDGRFYDRVINSTPGKLAEDLLRTIEVEHKRNGRPTRANMGRLQKIMRDDSYAGHQARGACVQSIGFLIYINEHFVVREFVPRLREDNRQGATLRAVMCQWAQLGAVATRLVKSELMRGVIESTTSDMPAQRVAAQVLSPRLSPRLTNPPVDWGFEDNDAAYVLKHCGDNIRIATAQCLSIWQRTTTDPSPSELWSAGTRPLFEAVWPQERKFKHPRVSGFLADCCTHTGDKFPEAVDVFRPYLVTSLTGSAGLFSLPDDDVATRFPTATLDLLWVLFRLRRESVGAPFLASTLDAIKAADPTLELDRRFQWLETISVRFA